jgi:ribonuclease HI
VGVKHVKVFGDSQLVVQQMLEEYQCLDGILNYYLERCWDIVRSFDNFNIRHKSRHKNFRANGLHRKLHVIE